jgi:hypothetical protein
MTSANKKGRDGKTSSQPADTKATKTLRPAGEAQVSYKPSPTRPPQGKTIHRRRPLPMVPDKVDEK